MIPIICIIWLVCAVTNLAMIGLKPIDEFVDERSHIINPKIIFGLYHMVNLMFGPIVLVLNLYYITITRIQMWIILRKAKKLIGKERWKIIKKIAKIQKDGNKEENQSQL